jgi:niacin transporter
MAIELAAYGLFAGLFMYILQKIMVKRIRKTIRIYISLILSMVFGRIIYAIVLFIMLKVFVMDVPGPISVITSAITGVPGIIIQLILVPAIVSILNFSQERYLG